MRLYRTINDKNLVDNSEEMHIVGYCISGNFDIGKV